MKYNKDTGEKILKAANNEFEEKGYNGARMQSIANRAGINKALLHYYYKSKDALFQIIIKKAFSVFVPKIINVFNENLDIFTMIEKFVSNYIDVYIEHPRIPGFITQEINNNPARLVQLLSTAGVDLSVFKNKINEAIENNLIEETNPEQLILNIISLCLFPFIAKPIVTELLLEGSEEKFNKLIEARKKEVAQFIIKAIKK